MALASLDEQLKHLAARPPVEWPVVSLYLDLRPDQHGRDDYGSFVRKALSERLKSLPSHSAARDSLEQDVARIQRYLDGGVDRAANGLALFACAGAGLFEVLQIEAPIEEHWLFVAPVPHLYPLARLLSLYPRYAAVLLDANRARIFVFGLATLERAEQVTGEKTGRHAQGGWSQARYQRHIEHLHLQHVKDVVDHLERVVRQEGIDHIVVAGPEDALALLRETLPKPLGEKVESTTTLPLSAPETEVLRATLASFQDTHAVTDAERVDDLLNAWRSGGLGVAGPEATLSALSLGQVDELLLTGDPATLKPVQRLPDDAASAGLQADTSAPQGTGDERRLQLAGVLVAKAEQTGARIRVIRDPALLAEVGGVAALLRFRI